MRTLRWLIVTVVLISAVGVAAMVWIGTRPIPNPDVATVNDLAQISAQHWGSLTPDDYPASAADFTVVDTDGEVVIARGSPLTGLNAAENRALSTQISVDGRTVGQIYVHDTTSDAVTARIDAVMRAGVGTVIALLIAVCVWAVIVYRLLLRPFRQMTDYAEQVASGDTDTPLPMDRTNAAGEFTEAFDLMREELARTRAAEQEAKDSKRDVIAQLSHDIRTPLATIQATAELLALSSDPTAAARLAVITAKSRHIEQLMTDLFDANDDRLQALDINLVDLTSDGLARLVRRCDAAEHIDAVDIEDCLVRTDRKRFTQVIENILGNAAKYGAAPITIRGRVRDGFCLVSVHDCGNGVPADELEAIQARGVRGSNAGTRPGLGLGLYTASTLMERMHGSLVCRNDSGGFTVELSVPLAG